MLKAAGDVLLMMSGDDYTTREFDGLVAASSPWQKLTQGPHWTWRAMEQANHTFDTASDKRALTESFIEWMETS